MPYMGSSFYLITIIYHSLSAPLSHLCSPNNCPHTRQNSSRILDKRRLKTGFKHTLALKWVLSLNPITPFWERKKKSEKENNKRVKHGIKWAKLPKFWHWKLQKLTTQMAQNSRQSISPSTQWVPGEVSLSILTRNCWIMWIL
jgi:hypothetical protein